LKGADVQSKHKKVLVIGSGPIVIGQAAEFDYAGTQCCEALKSCGIEVVLINSNPATIMTDVQTADRVYIEPLTVDFIEKIIAKERPDAMIAGMGGQTALNLAVELSDKGILEKYHVEVIGTSIDSIKRGEDRELFKNAMEKIGEPLVESKIITTIEDGLAFALEISYPVIVRPAYTLGGSGGGIAHSPDELRSILALGLKLSRVGQVLLEKSIFGWKEVEYEVMRDAKGNVITVCNMENIDPVGVHTGDSIVVAPSQTLSDKEYQMLRTASLNIIDEIKIVGGCNVQFALHPKSAEYKVIEINPRVSRSSALASKATGYPIAKIATKIALGYALDEIINDVTGKTYACFEPALDYVVVKIPRWPFDKFKNAKRKLGTKMMATGEVMSIGSNFELAFLKAIRSLEIGQETLDLPISKTRSIEKLKKRVTRPDDERIFDLAELLRRGYMKKPLQKITGIDMFFMEKIEWIVRQEEMIKKLELDDLTPELLRNLKKKGFSDRGIAQLMGVEEEDISKRRKMFGITPVYKMVDTCAGEFEAVSPYYYSTYDLYDEAVVSDQKKIIIIGSGPIRIGQGIEFDYCTVHCVNTIKKMGYEAIVINNNPETVSTDFSVASKLYFEPLVFEDVMNIIEKENPLGVVLQFGGQTAIKLAQKLSDSGINIIGTSALDIDLAEDREKFEAVLENLNLARPKGKAVWSVEEGLDISQKLGFPLLVRPSYVLGGQGMEICHSESEVNTYLKTSFARDSATPVLIDKYLNGMEIEVDVICDGEDILLPGIMEHLERAGIHSGDSITIFPAQNLYEGTREKILTIAQKLSQALRVKGMMNIQFIAYQGELYIIEVNPRASRTVPYIAKVSGLPIIEIATKVMLGSKLKELPYGVGMYKTPKYIAAKVPVFSTEKLPGVEVTLGPEMKSTGEVLGIAKTAKEAIYKGLLAANRLPKNPSKEVIVSIADKDKEEFLEIAQSMNENGYHFLATENTHKFLANHGIVSEKINRMGEESPNITECIRNREIDFLINIPSKVNDALSDGFKMRRIAIEYGTEVISSLDTLKAIISVENQAILSSIISINEIQ